MFLFRVRVIATKILHLKSKRMFVNYNQNPASNITSCLNTKRSDLHLKLRNKMKMPPFRLSVEHEIFYSSGQRAKLTRLLFVGQPLSGPD